MNNDFWKGFWNGAGKGCGLLLVASLPLLNSTLRAKLIQWVKGLSKSDTETLTISLGVSALILLALLIWSQVSYFRFKRRVIHEKLTPAELNSFAWRRATKKVCDEYSAQFKRPKKWWLPF